MSLVWPLPIEVMIRATEAARADRSRRTDRHAPKLWLTHSTDEAPLFDGEAQVRHHLRYASEVGRAVYRAQRALYASASATDPVKYRRHARAAETAVRRLLEHGPIAVNSDDGEDAMCRHGRLEEALGDITALADAFRDRTKGSHDPALRDAAAAMCGVLAAAVPDPAHRRSVIEDAWLDANLPDGSDPKAGTKFGSWLSKYLKNNGLG